MSVCAALATSLRALAILRNWSLPVWRL